MNADADPDPATQINADPCGSGSDTLRPRGYLLEEAHTDKQDDEILLIYEEIWMGSGAKSYMRKGILKIENVQIFNHTVYEEAVSHI